MIRFPTDYTKQNADAQLVWKATKWLNLGASYDWERWNRTLPCGQYDQREHRQGFPRLEVGLLHLAGEPAIWPAANDGYTDWRS